VSGPQAVEYEVRSGDSLWSIARMHGLTVTELRRANGIRGSRIDPGQTLTIPASTSRKISL
jgi:LysM repeat protein